MPKSEGMLHATGLVTRLPSWIAYVTNVGFGRSEMSRLLRLFSVMAVCAALLASAACEDDPHDLDYLNPDAGKSEPDEDDAG